MTLLSPAFFQDKNEAFKRAQLRYFKLNRELYIKNFLENIAYPSRSRFDTISRYWNL